MNRKTFSQPIDQFDQVKLKLLNWVSRFDSFSFLDNNLYSTAYQKQECLIGAGAYKLLNCTAGNAFDQLHHFYTQENDWLFGHLGFGLKNEVEKLSNHLPDPIGFSDLYFFVPEVVVELSASQLKISTRSSNPEIIIQEILDTPIARKAPVSSPISLKARLNKQAYLDRVLALQQHIQRGDCYEINFCQEFYAEEVSPDPVSLYLALSAASPNPFSAFYRNGSNYLICASPERYLQKTGNQLIAQPIKGTWHRSDNALIDENYKQALYNSSKDRSENVMVVDLIRNDLSKVCKPGTVKVDELYGIYTYPLVHQMISTISGTLENGLNGIDALKQTFPMGSMTGAPKKRVLELIEQYETTARGLFSGTVGYISPSGDFDFNVVIRSILYNEATGYLSCLVGSGLTFYSKAELEYEECLLKGAAIRKVLEGI